MTDCCAGCAEPGKYSHTTDCLFEHFLGYMNFAHLPDKEKARLRTAYGYGMEEGERTRLVERFKGKLPRRMSMQEPASYKHLSYGICEVCQEIHVEGPCK